MKAMSYLKHLWENCYVAGHALRDAVAHLAHGLFPGIKIKHHDKCDRS